MMVNTDFPATTARELLARMLRRAFPKGTAKRAAAAAGWTISHRTVEDYLQRRSEPSASVLFAWAHDPAVRAELIGLLEDIARAEKRLMAEAEGQGAFDFAPGAAAVRPAHLARRGR